MGKEYQSPKQVIQSYLEERAKSDPLFVTSYTKPNKNIDECYDYIIGEAKNAVVVLYVCLTMKYSDWQFITMMKMISKLVSSLQ